MHSPYQMARRSEQHFKYTFDMMSFINSLTHEYKHDSTVIFSSILDRDESRDVFVSNISECFMSG